VKVIIDRAMFKKLTKGRRSIGIGDLIEKVAAAAGVKACTGCKKRKKSFNRLRFKV